MQKQSNVLEKLANSQKQTKWTLGSPNKLCFNCYFVCLFCFHIFSIVDTSQKKSMHANTGLSFIGHFDQIMCKFITNAQYFLFFSNKKAFLIHAFHILDQSVYKPLSRLDSEQTCT